MIKFILEPENLASMIFQQHLMCDPHFPDSQLPADYATQGQAAQHERANGNAEKGDHNGEAKHHEQKIDGDEIDQGTPDSRVEGNRPELTEGAFTWCTLYDEVIRQRWVPPGSIFRII